IDDVYLVSNVNGAPDAKDGNGFVSRVALSGELLAREWTTGEPSLASGPLHAPKGMALLGDLLAVTDIDVVRFFDRRTGKAEFSVGTVGWTFLNDLVADGEGGLLVTDTGTAGEGDGVYRIVRSGRPDRHGRLLPVMFSFDKIGNDVDPSAAFANANWLVSPIEAD